MNALETALELLEDIKNKFDISPQDYITVCTPLQELVCIFVLVLWLLDLIEGLMTFNLCLTSLVFCTSSFITYKDQMPPLLNICFGFRNGH